MKAHYKLSLTLLAGMAIGAAAVEALHAQAKPPVYIVNEIDVTDQAAFQAYADAQSTLIQKNGGRYIIRGGKVTAIDGAPPKRFSVYVFDSADRMKAWQDDPGEKAVWAMREKAGKFRSFAVEGVTN
jgi:uncharacterized protein (DUF1330 family)